LLPVSDRAALFVRQWIVVD